MLTGSEREFVRGVDKTINKINTYKGAIYRSLDNQLMADEDEFNAKHQPGNIVIYDAYFFAKKYL